ncbi:MAG: YfcE family phosphodiesterase [Chloroflexi bacterium]|nr:YfcE family phosphodiesterase [Chloroflexota bacterium]
MKIGVLSDTHFSDLVMAQRFADQLLAGHFADVAAILHAGDTVIPALESCFYRLPWYAVRGNMDLTSCGVPESRVVRIGGKLIGMIHGWGSSKDIEKHVLQSFQGQPSDALVFGHSHMPVCRYVGPMLLFNPGSPTDRRSAKNHTIGILILGSRIEGEIIALDG